MAAIQTTGVTFQINNTSWNKYRSEITAQPKSNNLDYLIDPAFSTCLYFLSKIVIMILHDPAFRNINNLFVLSFKNSDNDTTWYSFDEHYMPLVEIKDFHTLMGNNPFFLISQ